MKRQQRIMFLDMGGAPPPREVRLFPKGEFGTTKGPLRYTERSERLIKKQWAQLGRDFGFDWGHAQFDKTVAEEDKIAAGWGQLDFRADGLYVVNIGWTERAAARIGSKEMRYLSPALISDKSGEITGVYNCALTNLPATHGALPLVLSAAPHLPGTNEPRIRRRSLMAKPTALAQGLMKHMTGLMAGVKDGSQAEHEGLKALCTTLAGSLPEHFEALRGCLTELGIQPGEDDDEDEDSEDKKELSLLSDLVKQHAPGKEKDLLSAVREAMQLRAAVAKATGKDKGLVGVFTALHDTAKRAPKTDPAVAKAIDKGVRLRKIHPSDTERFLSQSAEDVEAYIELSDTIDGPTSQRGRELNGAARLDGTGSSADKAAQEAADKHADQIWSGGR